MQWRMYERVVREAGLRPTTWFDDSSIPPADVYHAFNVDRPLELYPKLAEVKRRGRPFILSTIHHPHEWMTKYYTSQPSAGALGSLLHRSALGRSMPARETIREIVTVARDRRIDRLLALIPSWRQRVRWLLRNADRIMLLTDSEATYLQTDFAYEIPRQQQVIVPNWPEGLGDCIGWETGRTCRPSGATRAGRWSDRASEGKPTHISAGGACASSRGLCRSPAPWRRRVRPCLSRGGAAEPVLQVDRRRP